MPIVDIEIVGDRKALLSNLAEQLASELGNVFGSRPNQTWVRVRSLPSEQYAENQLDNGPQPQPVFVTILKAHRPNSNEIESEVGQITEVVASICQRPLAHVHLLYEPEGNGRVAFGGRLV
ncbi:hypothetical protein KFU94_66240 [Chloroflexi bacterium TSY]|nr:hypothetical protein [Chloroflexi bacterium TSY]